MKRYDMIKDKDRFNFIIKTGKFVKSNFFVVYYVKSLNENSLFGIAIKRSIGNAVTRNRLKRQTRSIIDNNRNLFKNYKDYIIMIREGCKNGSFNDMNESMKTLLKGID